MYKDIVRSIEMIHFDVSGLTANYQVMNELGFEYACALVRLENASNTHVMISFDGINDHDYVFNDSRIDLPVQDNCIPTNFVMRFEQGTKVYVKQSPGGKAGIGNIYLIGYY